MNTPIHQKDQQQLLQKLQDLLAIVPPKSLRQSLHATFFAYLDGITEAPPARFNEVTSDISLLLQFLEEVETTTGKE